MPESTKPPTLLGLPELVRNVNDESNPYLVDGKSQGAELARCADYT